MPIAARFLTPLLGVAGAALAQPALAQPAVVPPPDMAPPADAGPVIAAPPHAATMDPAVAAQAAQPGDRFGFQNVADVAVFQDALAAHGRWVNSRWGNAFLPDAPDGWRPYQNGEWSPDRFWRSADPWGWATDHYGRWGFDDSVGWVWVPGTEWAPSWTAWREDDDVVGWAPIPPQVRYRWDAGFDNDWRWNDWNSWYAPSWIWVPRTQVFAGGYRTRALPWHNGARYWRGSRWNWGLGFSWNDWGRRGGTSVSIGFGNGWNNWGWNNWNRPWGYSNWSRPWAAQQPWGWNNWGWNRPGWGWNNRGWNNRNWDNRGRNDWRDRDRGRDRDWDRDRNRDWRGNDPRRGAPGSVGDYIGRGLNGAPPPAPGDGRRRDGFRGDGRADNGFRGDGFRGDGFRGRNPDGNGGFRSPRPERMMGNPAADMGYRRPPGGDSGSVGASIGRAMAPPPSAPAPSPPPSREFRPDDRTRPQ
ncbi:hypothetical protein CHU93_05100 [Sandarakinorhabdus cyanobacteriorum]|uniref:Uncharacterized protein n=1 Tax=Sandarakinorhabdus cyanobacteriorum TaxID=1981098 RepID=A0A255YPQ5_9SPHN|nr:DUF6600 domain-containing protein [Sandarakinorhabdus cyanobacteriorum]OYQ31181.1 hypothetical protein CHU93_05100 [Sandarakinorhabdus cyanobacteriorum]